MKQDKNYVSELDQFMTENAKEIKLSASQLAELKKFQRIFNLRDNKQDKKEEDSIWEDF